MSGWRVFVQAVAESQAPIDGRAFGEWDVRRARELGLVAAHRQGGAPALYTLTERGKLLAEGRLGIVPERRGIGRPRDTLGATWLRALPSGVTMDKRQPRAVVSEWGGLPL